MKQYFKDKKSNTRLNQGQFDFINAVESFKIYLYHV